MQDLEAQLRRARESATATPTETGTLSPSLSGTAEPHTAAAGGPGLLTTSEHVAIVRQRLVRQRQEFEGLLEKVLAGDAALLRSAPGGVLLPEDTQGLLDRHLSRVGARGATSDTDESETDRLEMLSKQK